MTLDLYCVLEIYEVKIQVQFPRVLLDRISYGFT